MKIAQKVFITCIVVLVSILLLASTTFASTILDPETITATLKVTTVKWTYDTTWSVGRLDSTGAVVSDSSGNYRTSAMFTIPLGGKSIIVRNTESGNYLRSLYIAFYDSNNNLIYVESPQFATATFYDIPYSDAAYFRITVSGSYNVTNSNRYYKIVCPPTSQQHTTPSQSLNYLWDSPEDLTVTDDYAYFSYQPYGYNEIMMDYQFFDDARSTRHLNLEMLFECTASGVAGSPYEPDLFDYTDVVYFRVYYYDSYGQKHYWAGPNDAWAHLEFDTVTGTCYTSEPYMYLEPGLFSGFEIRFRCSGVSNYIRARLLYFELDDSALDTVIETSDSITDLNNIGDALALPTPNSEVILDGIDNLAGQLNNGEFNSISFFGSSDGIFTSMCVTVLLFASLGYIFFGKMS